MFILRTVVTDKTEHNTVLGSKYHLTLKTHSDQKDSPEKTKAIEKFEAMIDFVGVNDKYLEEIFAIITTEAGNVHIPLFSSNDYYVMTSDGKTFAMIKA